MKIIIALTISLSLLMFASIDEAGAQVDDDARLWAGFTGKVDLIGPLRLDVTQELRLDDNVTGYEKSFTDLSLRYRANQYLRLSAHYRLIIADTVMGTDAQNRVAASADVQYRFKPFTVAYRLRLQTTDTNNGTSSFVRNKITGSYELTDKMSPFAAFEVHYSTTASEFRQLRFFAGLEYELTKKLDIEGYYLYRYEYNVNAPERNHILGIGVSYQFREIGKGKGKDKDKDKDDDDDDKDAPAAGD